MRAAMLTTTVLAATLLTALTACTEEPVPVPSPLATTSSAAPTPSPTASVPAATPTAPTSEPAPPEVPSPTDDADGCSSDGVPVPAAPQDLPEEVLATWLEIRDAAADCDIDRLARLATPRTTFSYGGGGIEVVERAEEHGDGDLGTLLRLLALSHGEQTTGEGTSHAWPGAHLRETWADTPRAERRELRAIHSAEEIASFAEYGHYLGWRLGIGADGSWRYYVAGD